MIPERPAKFAFSRIRKSGAKTHFLLGENWNTENFTRLVGRSIQSPTKSSKAHKILQISFVRNYKTNNKEHKMELRTTPQLLLSIISPKIKNQHNRPQPRKNCWISSSDLKVGHTFQISSSLRASSLIGFSCEIYLGRERRARQTPRED